MHRTSAPQCQHGQAYMPACPQCLASPTPYSGGCQPMAACMLLSCHTSCTVMVTLHTAHLKHGNERATCLGCAPAFLRRGRNNCTRKQVDR
jgi:hypothetical protein